MQYPDNWVFDYDQETLTSDFISVSHMNFLGKTEPSISLLKTLSLSFNDYENDLQKLLINQHQLLFSFFNTEVLCNESNLFQYFSQKVVKYIETEILYSASFWAFGPLRGFVRHRVNASLIRTLKFLSALQIMVLERYNQGKLVEYMSETELEKDSLSQNLEDLLVDYQQLNTLVVYFRKTYAELHTRLQAKNLASQKELNFIARVIMFCKLFFIVNPKAIWKAISKTVPENAERELVLDMLRDNDALKNEIYEKTRKYTSLEHEKKGIQDYLMMQLGGTSTFKKVVKELDKNHKFPIYEEESQQDRRRGAGRFTAGVPEDGKEDSKERRKTIKVDRLKEAFSRNQNEQPKEGPTKEEIKKEKEKEKEKERFDLLSILQASPNNPMKNSRFIPIDSRISMIDYQLGKIGKSTSDINTMPRIGTTNLLFEETKSRRELAPSTIADELLESEFFPPSELSEFENTYDNGTYDVFLKYNMNEDFMMEIETQKLEPRKLREKNEPRAFQGENKARNFFQRKKTKQASQQSLFAFSNKKNDAMSEETLQFSRRTSVHVDDDASSRKRGLSAQFKAAMLRINELDGSGYVPAKEDKGVDIPDEELLGNLVDDEDEDDDEEDFVDDKKKKNVKEEPEHNKFVSVMQQIKEQRSMFSIYFKPGKLEMRLSAMDSVDAQRRRDKWTFAKDKCKTNQVQNDILQSMEEDDPTYGLDIAIRSLEYLGRSIAWRRNGAVDFSHLGKQKQLE